MEIVPAYDMDDEVARLFSEYTAMLVDRDPLFSSYLDMQSYGEELASPGRWYSPPDGRLYVAIDDGVSAGCIGLKRLDGKGCEMKRLYVRPRFRGRGHARRLCERIIADAVGMGFRFMYLDTLPFLTEAVALYERLGFELTEPYNNSPMGDSIFMRKEL